MKLIHLADLHLGRHYETIELREDQKNVLSEILGLIRSEDPKPDAVLIAGDVYDRSLPPEWAVGLMNDFLLALSDICPVLVISGNHDSGERLSFLSDILSRQSIYIAGTVAQALKPVTIGDADFWLMPYLDPAEVNRCLGTSAHTMEEAVNAILDHREPGNGRYQVLVSHLFAAGNGIQPVESDSERNPVGGQYAVDVNVIKDFDYVALGHLHGAQKVGGLQHVRYAGSPLMYSFNEDKQKKSITVVELGEGEPVIRLLPLEAGRRMRRIRGTLEEILKTQPDDRTRKDFCCFELEETKILPDADQRLRSVYDNVKIRYMNLDVSEYTGVTPIDISEVERLDDMGLLELFFRKQFGQEMSDEERAMILPLVETIRKERD